MKIKNKMLFYSFLFILYILLHSFLPSCIQKKQKNVFPTIFVSKEDRFIMFDTSINFSVKEKYFLFYFVGYPWLKDYCVFTTSSSLKELQTAIALIDWQLWDKIYTQKYNPKLKIEIYTDTGWISLDKVLQIKNFNFYQTTFWGSPIYDSIVLERNYTTNKCVGCDLLPLEESLFLDGLTPLHYKFLKPLKQKFKVRIHILNMQQK